MSLIGGYFYKSGKIPARLVSEKLESFAIIPSEDSRHYENVIAKGQFAHISAKFKNNAPGTS